MIPLVSIVLSNLAVAVLLAVFVSLIGARSRRYAIVHLLWFAVLVKLVTPAIVETPFPLPHYLFDPAASLLPDPTDDAKRVEIGHRSTSDHSTTNVEQRATIPSPANQEDHASMIYFFLGSLWIGVTVYLLATGVWRFIAFARLIQREAKEEPAGTELVQELLGRRTRAPPVLLLPARVSPMLFGIGRWTSIVCPQTLWESLDATDRRAFLAHEVAHFLRRDHWVRWAEWFVSSVYWWCPLTHIARRQLERFEELACDSWAVERIGGKRRQYGATLLKVVDYMSEATVATPRLSSQLHPNNLLEERLHLLRGHQQVPPNAICSRGPCIAVCCLLLFIHPHPFRLTAARGLASGASAELLLSVPEVALQASLSAGSASYPAVDLPDAPRGWWTSSPSSVWASIPLADDGTTLFANAGQGLTLRFPEKPDLHFPSGDLCSFVVLPGVDRIVIGDVQGALRIWDLRDATAVSLIGKHAAPITSMAFHRDSGLVAADAQGSVMHWSTESGDVINTWTTRLGPVQSVRCSADGQRLAVLLGTWASEQRSRQLVELDIASMEPRASFDVSGDLAVVVDSGDDGWLSVTWTGVINRVQLPTLPNGPQWLPIGQMPKDLVSSLVLSQNAVRVLDYIVAHPAESSLTKFLDQH